MVHNAAILMAIAVADPEFALTMHPQQLCGNDPSGKRNQDNSYDSSRLGSVQIDENAPNGLAR